MRNIAAITTNILQPNGASNLQAQLFRYDALNRIKQSVTVDAKQKMLHNGPLSWNNSTTNTLSSIYSYDASGNLTSLTRKNESNQTFDNFEYQYNTNTNQLNHIKDFAAANNGVRTDDIDNQSVGNYNYDSDGRLTKDVHDGITNIIWTRDNRPKQVTKNFNGINEVINYHYDFQGFKIIQTINRSDSVFKQHYVRDPQGSVLAIYTDSSATNYKKLTLSELSIYGSSRLGTIQLDSVLYKQNGNSIVTPTISNVYAQKLGLKRYELSNHLGNVTTVVSDRKFIQGNGQNAVFVADIVSVTDYYAYGMKISERTWGKDARYQYNGKEQDKGFGRYNFDGRMYDERSCRWMSLDPQAGKYAGISPYVGFANNPIMFVDPDGEDNIIQINGEKNKGFRQIRYNVDGSLSERISKDGKIVYVNYKAPAGSYEAKVKAQLDYLRTMKNDEIKTRMNVLQSSTNMHIVQAPKEGKNAHNENEGDKENSSFVNKWEDYGTSTGSGSHYDPLNWVTARGDVKPPVVTLAHELLGHGYDREIGKSVVIKTGKLSSNGNDILFEEVLAVRVENIVRDYMHKEFEKSKTDIGVKIFKNTNPRTTYGGTDIQSELDKIEKDKVGFPQPRKK